MLNPNFQLKQFAAITFITSIWINISEVFRYFIFVRPEIKNFFDNKSSIADMDINIFLIWGLWDTLLTAILVFVFWLCSNIFGNNIKSIFISSILVWASVFVIFWIATANMGLSNWSLLFIALPLSLLEMIIGAWIISKLYIKNYFF